MIRINNEELKEIEKEILEDVTRFCEENSIRYWLDQGTLLGAVRHKGFIPWDNDIDIGMLREDFDKFISLYDSRKYRVHCVEKGNADDLTFAKVYKNDTLLYDNSIPRAINIDVFPYDYLSNDENLAEKQLRRCAKNYMLLMLQTKVHRPRKGNSVKRMLIILARKMIRLFPKGYFSHKVICYANLAKNNNKDCVAMLTIGHKDVVKADLFRDIVKIEFEGKEYCAPRNYDSWLTIMYGDYMTLPPEEERYTHPFEAYILNE